MKSAESVAHEIAKKFIPAPQRLREEMSEAEFFGKKEQYEFAVEAATGVIAHMIAVDRIEIREEVQEVCALIAETEYSDPRWKNHEQRIGAGIWIAETIRKCFSSYPATNNITRKRSASAWVKQLIKQASENTKSSKAKEKKDDRRTYAHHDS